MHRCNNNSNNSTLQYNIERRGRDDHTQGHPPLGGASVIRS